jgi:hypothetical protein
MISAARVEFVLAKIKALGFSNISRLGEIPVVALSTMQEDSSKIACESFIER